LKLFRRAKNVRPSEASNALRARAPDGARLYAIGDVHGRSDLLSEMANLILLDLEHLPGPSAHIIFLGDYVGRGPDSKGVLTRLSAGFPASVTFLRGNHEGMLLAFLSEPEIAGPTWLPNGGLETLHSYGVSVAEVRRRRGYIEAAQAFSSLLPAEHLEFLHKTALSADRGDYFFCHAGVRPGLPLHQQREEDLLWIRDPFLTSTIRHPKVVVHGHTPVLTPDVRGNRINVDTGAYMTGRLTSLVLEGESRRFLTTGSAA
jgi:serine/threonine protein phosphatase 1